MAKADVLRRVRQNLYSTRPVEHPWLQEISAIGDDTTTSITVDDGTVWDTGDILEVEETGEQCYVRSISTNTLTVIRGFNGTTAAATTDSVPLVRKNPQFTQQEIEDQYNHVLNSLWGHGVWAWNTTAVVADSTKNPQLEIELSCLPRHIVSVSIASTNSEGEEVHVPFRLRQVGDNTEVMLYWPAETDFNESAVLVRTDPITDIDADDVHPDVEQVLEDGVTYRVMASSMASRLLDPGLLTDRTVQPGQGGRDARFYQGEFVLGVRRISQELKVEKANRRVGQDYHTSRARRWRV